MRERDEDQEKITVEPATVAGQSTENPSDEAKILADQDQTIEPADRQKLQEGTAELEDRQPNTLYAGDSEDFVHGDIDVKEMMDRRMRASEDAVERRQYKSDALKQMDGETVDSATPTAPLPNRAPDAQKPGTTPLPRT